MNSNKLNAFKQTLVYDEKSPTLFYRKKDGKPVRLYEGVNGSKNISVWHEGKLYCSQYEYVVWFMNNPDDRKTKRIAKVNIYARPEINNLIPLSFRTVEEIKKKITIEDWENQINEKINYRIGVFNIITVLLFVLGLVLFFTME